MKRKGFRKVGTKILAGFLSVALLVILLGGYNYLATTKMNDDTESILDRDVQLLISYEELAFNMAQRVALSRAYVLFGDEEYKTSFEDYSEKSKEIQVYILEATPKDGVQDLINKSTEWENHVEEYVFTPYDNGNDRLALQELQQTSQPLAREIMSGFEQVVNERETKMNEKGDTIIAVGKSTQLIVTIITLLVIIASIAIAWFTSRMIANPIRDVMKRMNAIADGDLSHGTMTTKLRDEVGQLIDATNTMNEKMKTIMQQISGVSESVTSQSEELTQSASEVREGSQQIAATMQELAAGSETQARLATELSESMGEFTARVNDTGENGRQLESSTNDVLELTTSGAGLMENSSDQMTRIDGIVKEAYDRVTKLDEQSKQISELVEVIKSISEQTNLLALNAAIEAARAGEHGKGFAVVADEVRKLSEQVADSVTEITGIVGSIQQETSNVASSLQNGYGEVTKGTHQILETKTTFVAINEAIKTMVQNISVMSDNVSAIRENTKEVSIKVEEIAAISEESAAGVEQTTASSLETSSSMEDVSKSSDDLAKMADSLNAMVRQFKL
ncbi:methyl-accepting chemotaxis protein [Paenisporosarcina cavernae]|uniref:Methyl-accepting chemotaxis protein n=1 Tax=Paenisporosarcina cavernae TaxID=2320858 RepID=A0A385YRI1_9BACL|nr:methyl-accepting chemotaxis protein [Paenisporosarcina cavernae]AYC28607.1 methyl-accepting chemotaxis protein [Paenisporosarcina cavernae]